MEQFTYSYRLAELRRKTGKSQKEVAEELSVTPASLSAYEKGTKMPSMEVAVKLASYYKVSLDYIFRPRDAESRYPSSYADVLKCLFKISRADLQMSIEVSHHPEGNYAELAFRDGYLCKIFSAWSGLLESNKNGMIDDEILEIWERKKMEEAEDMPTPWCTEIAWGGFYLVDVDEES